MMASCANTSKVLQGDQYILYRNQYDITMMDGSEVPGEVKKALDDVSKYVRQLPKNGLLDIHHSFINTYYGVSISDSSWWARTMRNIGTAPVIYSKEKTEQSVQQIASLLEGRGCFNSIVTSDTQQLSRKRVVTTYHIVATPRYIIDDIDYVTKDTAVRHALETRRDASSLTVGDYYDQDNLIAERTALANLLQRRGFFLANADLIHFAIDTTYAPQRMAIEVIFDQPEIRISNDQVESRPYQRYYIGHIHIDSNNVDTSTIQRVLTIKEGQRYSTYTSTSSYNSLVNLRNFSLINIEYKEAANSTDQRRLLDTRIRLHNSNQQKISGSFEISNASPISRQSTNSGNFGAEAVLQYQHKNLFGGAELLSVSGNILIELNKSVFSKGLSNNGKTFSAFETGISLSLDLPQFLFPMGSKLMRGISLPHTLIGTGFNRQYRTYFDRWQADLSFGYEWKASRTVQHKMVPMEISYVNFTNLSDDFFTRIINIGDTRILNQYSDHLIVNAKYEFTYSNQFVGRQVDFSYFNASIETAGNLAAIIATSKGLRHTDDFGDAYTLANVPYSQYFRLTSEFKHYFYHGDQKVFVARAFAGIGIPYGNSTSMPYEKSFFGGGPNNVRAWQVRHLGPGHYIDSDNQYSFDKIGDMTLVFNLEERFPIFNFLEGALFVDIGNIWQVNEDNLMPGAQFDLKNFFIDMALGFGVGMRFKISILTLRLDFSMPAYDPCFVRSERWRFKHWTLSSINTNFGIDYPF